MDLGELEEGTFLVTHDFRRRLDLGESALEGGNALTLEGRRRHEDGCVGRHHPVLEVDGGEVA